MNEQQPPPSEAAIFTSIREWGLIRGANGLLGGVVEGVGNKIGLARVPARLLTVLAWILLPGLVMVAYAAGWALLPDQHGNIIIQNFGRGVTNVGALIGIAVLALIGIVAFDSGPAFDMLRGGRDLYLLDHVPFRALAILIPVFFVLVFVTGAVVLVVWLARRSNRQATHPHPMAQAHASQTPGTPVAGHTAGSSPEAAAASTTGPPQPWESALLPGDPRTGVPASSATAKARTNAAHATGAPVSPGYAAPATGPSGPAGGAPPPAPPGPPAVPARPPVPTVPGPGQGAYLAFAAVLLISAAITTWLDRQDMLAVSPILAWGASITVGLGLILLIVALVGRKLGFLGFLSVFAVFLAVLFSGNAEDMRAAYSQEWNWGNEVTPWGEEVITWDDEVADEEDDVDPFDLTTELGSRYSNIFIAGTCSSPNDAPTWSDVSSDSTSTASIRLDAVDEDTTIELSAWNTRLAIPIGTSLEVVGTGDVTVVWEGRDASCSLWNENFGYDDFDENGDYRDPAPQPILSVTNAGDPVLTVKADPDASIYIQEVTQ